MADDVDLVSDIKVATLTRALRLRAAGCPLVPYRRTVLTPYTRTNSRTHGPQARKTSSREPARPA
jgi:hypothetical protein